MNEENLMQLQMLHQHMQQIQQQVQMLTQQLGELAHLEEGLNELKDVEEGTEVLIPISNGIFAKASLKNPKELLVSVGANTTVPKKISDVIKLVKGQAEEVEHLQAELTLQLEKVSEQL